MKKKFLRIDYDNSANSHITLRYSRIEDSIIYTDYESNINEIRRSINNTMLVLVVISLIL